MHPSCVLWPLGGESAKGDGSPAIMKGSSNKRGPSLVSQTSVLFNF